MKRIPPRSGDTTSRTGLLSTVDHALAILEMFGPQMPETGVLELSRKLNQPPATVSRLLKTLASRGFLEQVETTRRYRLGNKFFEIAARVTAGMNLLDIAHPVLEHLARVSGERVHLSVWDGAGSLSVDHVDSPRRVSLATGIGSRRPPNASASAKCLLAFQPSTTTDRVLRAGLKRYTPRSIMDPQEMWEEIERVRSAGYAMNLGEHHPDVAGIAAPVRDRYGVVIAAIGIGFSMDRATPDHLAGLVPHVVSAGQALSVRLGWSADRASSGV